MKIIRKKKQMWLSWKTQWTTIIHDVLSKKNRSSNKTIFLYSFLPSAWNLEYSQISSNILLRKRKEFYTFSRLRWCFVVLYYFFCFSNVHIADCGCKKFVSSPSFVHIPSTFFLCLCFVVYMWEYQYRMESSGRNKLRNTFRTIED